MPMGDLPQRLRSCHHCAMSDADIERVLNFWFSDIELDSPRVDSRMDRWFSNNPALDEQIREEFMWFENWLSSGAQQTVQRRQTDEPPLNPQERSP